MTAVKHSRASIHLHRRRNRTIVAWKWLWLLLKSALWDKTRQQLLTPDARGRKSRSKEEPATSDSANSCYTQHSWPRRRHAWPRSLGSRPHGHISQPRRRKHKQEVGFDLISDQISHEFGSVKRQMYYLWSREEQQPNVTSDMGGATQRDSMIGQHSSTWKRGGL